ncbi:MAG: SUMF1/EgtB/PvdO family nonheme iron enzyme [Hyphomicrobiaceae bacterium]
MLQISLLQIIGFLLFAIIGVGLFAIQSERCEAYRWQIFVGCVVAFLGTALIGWLTYVPTPVTQAVDNWGKSGGGGGGGVKRSKGDGGGGKKKKQSSGGGGPSGKGAKTVEAAKTFSDCEDCPVMVIVPAGDNYIGSPEDDAAADPNEFPSAWVKFAEDFAVSQVEIKVGEFEKFADATKFKATGPCNTDGVGSAKADFRKPGMSQGPGHPVGMCQRRRCRKLYRLALRSIGIFLSAAVGRPLGIREA